MNDFISLICPACGGKLNVGKNTSVVICEYCEREHIVRRQNDGAVTLESFAQCPKCGRNDRVEKVSAVLRKEGKSSHKSDLASLLKPPIRPDLLPLPRLKEIKITANKCIKTRNILYIISGIGSFITLYLLIKTRFNSDVLFFIILTLVLIGLTWFFKKKCENKKDEIEDYISNLKVERNNWKIASEKWEKMYYCNRDDCIFIPGEGSYTKIDEIEKFIYKDLPKTKIFNDLKNQTLNQPRSNQRQNFNLSQKIQTKNPKTQSRKSYKPTINRCPSCGSPNISKPMRKNPSCIWLIITMGLGLIISFFTPKYVTCYKCGAKWKA